MGMQDNLLKNIDRYLEKDGLGKAVEGAKLKAGELVEKYSNNKKKDPRPFADLDFLEYPDSHWLESREYDRKIGVLAIFFNPIITNNKAPVVLGLRGIPIDDAFVKALDAGLYSTFWGYGDSVGAFYYKYIRQYNTFMYDGQIFREENKDRIVDAFEIDDLESHLKQIEALRVPQNSDEDRFKDAKRYLSDRLKTIIKDYSLKLNKENIKNNLDKYLEGKVKKWVQSKVEGAIVNTKTVSNIRSNVIKQLETNKAFQILSETNGRMKIYNMILKEKGIAGMANKGNIKSANNYFMRKKIRGQGIRKVRRAGAVGGRATKAELLGSATALEASILAAPETMGLSLLLGLGISLTMAMATNQNNIKKFGGKQAMDVVDIILLKQYSKAVLKRELKRELKENGMKGLVKGIAGELNPKNIPSDLDKAFKKNLQGWKPPDIR